MLGSFTLELAPPVGGINTGPNSKTCIALNVEKGIQFILGTQYGGEMKKGIFTMMSHWMSEQGVLTMQCSASEGLRDKDVTLFFGHPGSGKTTLSLERGKRILIGDDEHCWR